MAGARLLGALLTYAFGFDVDGFEGRDLVQADVTGTVSNVTIEPFTFGGCFSADLSAGALGFNYTTSIASSPSDCAVVCAAHEAFLVGQGACYCVEPSTFALGAWQQLEEVSCDAPCDRWSSLDFGSLTAYFQTLPGFCGSSTEGIFSYYETWTAVSAVGQGVLDRARALWWQVVMVQSLMSSSEHRDLFQEGTWLWRLHASSASTGRAAFPLHRDLDESILGLLMDEEPAMPMIMGTSYTGSLYAVPAGTRSPAQLVVAGASFPGHTVDGTSVQPGAAPVASFDQNRRTLFAAQPIGFGNSSLYALELDAPNELAYRHLRFIPFCNSSWCAVNELRFRYQELEIDMSSTLTYFMHDLTDPLLRHGAILIDFPAAVFIDEFSFSMPYNTTASAPTRWILQGSNDRVRRCSLTGAPSYQAMKDGTYVQMAGETFQGRTVYRDAAGAIIYWDQATLSWWVSPRIHEGGYGAIRCVGDAADPHLLSPASCVAWNGQLWDIAPNVSFSCRGNEWVVLHQQSRPYPLPDVPSAPLRWFKVSRVGVDWTLLIEDIPGLVGQLLSDLDDGYVAAGVTVGGESMLKTLGQIGGDKSQDRCSVSLRVNLSFVEGSDPGHAVDCAATAYGIGGWLWPDSQGSGKLWLTCANDTEFQADNWVQRYAEATADADFSFSGGLEKSPDAHVLKAQLVRILELAVAPTLLSGLSLSGPVNYFVCPTGTNCTFSPDLEVRIIKGGASCGCGEQVLTIETHGFYKACYCLTELMVAAAGSCSADADFTSLAGIVLGAGPEPARLARMEMALGSSWQPGITGFTSHTSIYQGMLQYALGADLSVSFPSLVAITNASEPVCGFNPSACDLVGEVFCALGEPCLARLNGTSMRSFNGLAVVRKDDTCSFALEHLAAFEGLSNPKVGCSRSDGHKASYRPVHTWDLGQPTRGATDVGVDEPGPGVYRLCWSYDPTNSTPGEEYPLDAGYLMMLGPLAMDFECFLNFPCVINISGIGLAASNKVLLVESSAGRCGDSNLPALDGRWNFSNPAAAGQDLFGSYNLYSFGLAKGKSGASHRICWAHDPTGSESSDFKVEIDPDFLWIRLTAIVDCVPGRTCSVAVLGSGILPSSQVLIIANSGRCGSASALEIPGLANPASPASTNGTSGMYVFGSAASTPLGFRICWGSAPSGEAAGFPVELQYPMYYEATVFATQVGAVNLALMDSERGGRHRALALFADPSETPSTSNALMTGSPAHWADFGTSAGHAAGAVLHIDGADRALPAVGDLAWNVLT
ncbi:unnamed protein product [Effrenium voratum]|uniref:WSC domain-containing protein n=1 Tax=Effrenium voratum TaxID=2562239 RepID=A0AA36N2W5_9DINO|nr:unnamed protein product [Effrenium voratum]